MKKEDDWRYDVRVNGDSVYDNLENKEIRIVFRPENACEGPCSDYYDFISIDRTARIMVIRGKNNAIKFVSLDSIIEWTVE